MRRNQSVILKDPWERSSRLSRGFCGLFFAAVLLALAVDLVLAVEPGPGRVAGHRADRADVGPGRSLPIRVEFMPTLRVPLSGTVRSIEATPSGRGQTASECPEPITVTHTDASFSGGDVIVQGGFAEDEIAAAVYVLSPDDFPIKIEMMECVFAQEDAIEPTVTQWSVLVWDGTPDNGIQVASFSSDDIILPHLHLEPGTQAANIAVSVDPDDPDPIYILNDSDTNTFSIGFRVDHHNHPPPAPCSLPDAQRNAFPTTDMSGVEAPDGNWLFGLDCPLGCPSGWHPFSELGLCQPSGDWIIRATYTRPLAECNGACCEPDGNCLDDMESDACDLLGGEFMGSETECASVTCPEPVGACCLDLTCLTDLTPSQCAEISAVYIGHGTSCDDDPCEPGACCMADGSCQDLIAVDCESAGGTFEGIDTDCGSFECPQPTGSCCIGSVCIPGQEQGVCEEVGTWNGIDSGCEPNPCVPQDCPEGTIIEVQPPSGAVDARQPHPVHDDSFEARQGIGGGQEPVLVTLSVGGAWTDCFTLTESSTDPELGPNEIDSVAERSPGTYEIQLLRPITTGAVTTISYDDASSVTYTSHPANADGDATASPPDVDELLAYISEVETPPHGVYSVDINHSGMPEPSDILRLIDLLNGAGLYQPWSGTELPGE